MSKVRIDPVNPKPVSERSSGGGSIVSDLLSPLGRFADAVSTIANAHVEIKRIKAEMHRVTEQAKLHHKLIDAAYNIEMQKLQGLQRALDQAFHLVEQDRRSIHLERMKLLETFDRLTQAAINPVLSRDDKDRSIEALKVVQAMLADSGSRGMDALKQAVGATQQALRQVPIAHGLLVDIEAERR